jgi:hypothetical protein
MASMINLDYDITQTDGITVIKFFCPPDIDSFQIALSDVRARFPSSARLWDCTCGNILSAEHLRKIGERAKAIDTDVEEIAIVVKDDGDFGLARMISVYRVSAKTTLKIYRSRQEALDWLARKNSDEARR